MLRGLAPLALVLLIIPTPAQAATTPVWMTPHSGALYVVKITTIPNQASFAYGNWTVVSTTSTKVTMYEDGILGVLGSLGVSLISSGIVTLLGLHVAHTADYNLTDRMCTRPCPQLNLTSDYAWEWIPSTHNSTLSGQVFRILQAPLNVTGLETLAPYNRTAWRLAPLLQIYVPYVVLGNFWYDRDTGILLRADLFSQGDGNLTMSLITSSSNLGIQDPTAVPVTSAQLALTFLGATLSFLALAPRMRLRKVRHT